MAKDMVERCVPSPKTVDRFIRTVADWLQTTGEESLQTLRLEVQKNIMLFREGLCILMKHRPDISPWTQQHVAAAEQCISAEQAECICASEDYTSNALAQHLIRAVGIKGLIDRDLEEMLQKSVGINSTFLEESKECDDPQVLVQMIRERGENKDFALALIAHSALSEDGFGLKDDFQEALKLEFRFHRKDSAFQEYCRRYVYQAKVLVWALERAFSCSGGQTRAMTGEQERVQYVNSCLDACMECEPKNIDNLRAILERLVEQRYVFVQDCPTAVYGPTNGIIGIEGRKRWLRAKEPARHEEYLS